ncbi:hypothetical protein NC652_012551 [Populus alba x Populus x berolinensis]|nr:hypothetical protein NC652_012541 [Populus alba x Populus x berolinensis]KAJ6928474.1 hypothetical protein NC652_012551 [Populus alba x Populus x berolinensis]
MFLIHTHTFHIVIPLKKLLISTRGYSLSRKKQKTKKTTDMQWRS